MASHEFNTKRLLNDSRRRNRSNVLVTMTNDRDEPQIDLNTHGLYSGYVSVHLTRWDPQRGMDGTEHSAAVLDGGSTLTIAAPAPRRPGRELSPLRAAIWMTMDGGQDDDPMRRKPWRYAWMR